jgi:hypothetical protein
MTNANVANITAAIAEYLVMSSVPSLVLLVKCFICFSASFNSVCLSFTAFALAVNSSFIVSK